MTNSYVILPTWSLRWIRGLMLQDTEELIIPTPTLNNDNESTSVLPLPKHLSDTVLDRLRDALTLYAVPFDWYEANTLVQHRPTAPDPLREFPMNAHGDPLIAASLLRADAATQQRAMPFPLLSNNSSVDAALVTPQGVVYMSIEHFQQDQPTDEQYPGILLYVNGDLATVLEYHPQYQTWVVRVYAGAANEPTAYLRLDTGESLAV